MILKKSKLDTVSADAISDFVDEKVFALERKINMLRQDFESFKARQENQRPTDANRLCDRLIQQINQVSNWRGAPSREKLEKIKYLIQAAETPIAAQPLPDPD